jgi:succinate dehydrogenase subunit C
MSRMPYVRTIPRVLWFFRHPRYVRYMTREVTCLFIGAYTLLMVWGLRELAQGPEAWAAFLQWIRGPWSVAFHVVALVFSVYHSVTWFNLTPKALPLQTGEAFVPDAVISGAHYAAWALLSVAILFLAGAF